MSMVSKPGIINNNPGIELDKARPRKLSIVTFEPYIPVLLSDNSTSFSWSPRNDNLNIKDFDKKDTTMFI